MRKIVIAGAVLVAIAGGAVFFLVTNLDSLVKTAVERIGSQVAGVPVTVAKVDMQLAKGRGVLEGVSIGNPPGFSTPAAITVGRIELAVDTGSVTSGTVVIKTVRVTAPQVTYEISPQGSNIQIIRKHVEAAAAEDAGPRKAAAPSGPARPAASDDQDEKKVIVDDLVMTGGKVTLATPVPGLAATRPLGDVHLTGIGRATGGASGAQVAGDVLGAVSAAALKAAGDAKAGGAVGALIRGAADGGLLKGLMGK